jgi:hypothetical protein
MLTWTYYIVYTGQCRLVCICPFLSTFVSKVITRTFVLLSFCAYKYYPSTFPDVTLFVCSSALARAPLPEPLTKLVHPDVMDDDNLPLAEFFYYTIGDETTYNQELNDLFVCYTFTRGLQFHCDHPRRPALPLEIILRIIRHAGFIDSKPDLRLTTSIEMPAMTIVNSRDTSSIWYMSEPLSRVQLASMAHVQLERMLESPTVKVPIFVPSLYYCSLILTCQTHC